MPWFYLFKNIYKQYTILPSKECNMDLCENACTLIVNHILEMWGHASDFLRRGNGKTGLNSCSCFLSLTLTSIVYKMRWGYEWFIAMYSAGKSGMSLKSCTRPCFRCQYSMNICCESLDHWSKKIIVHFDPYPVRKALNYLGLPLPDLFLFSRVLGNTKERQEVPFIFINVISLSCIFIFIACFVLIVSQLILLFLKQFVYVDISRIHNNIRTSVNISHFSDFICILILFHVAPEDLIFRF